MPVLPVPMFVAVVFGYLALRILVLRDRPAAFAVLLGAIAIQAVILSYRVFLPIQPVTAAMIPPLAWIVFQVTAVRPFDPGRDLWHAAVPAFTLFTTLTAPLLLDVLIPTVFVVYAGALLWRLRAGADATPRLSLATGERPGLVWRAIAGALLFSAVGDVAMAAAMGAGADWLRPWIVVVLTVGNLLGIGLLTLSGVLAAPPAAAAEEEDETAVPAATAPEIAAADAALMARIDALMAETRLYLDPDLTLARLARRLTLPAKQVSAAVNRATGENVSRLVNGWRVRHACARLDAGDGVTEAMLASGFGTKSNFNREFLRVTGMAPKTWSERGGDVGRTCTAAAGAVPPPPGARPNVALVTAHPSRPTSVP
ncbi:AraC family transcriptional regulator [Oharaeibacter diazotrophicus]|uniref:AraC-like DNA-binding protein n=1 Tax=Oharaeibacter diazotrophicus TaxID=1920512 RepID=A0A4R6R943_9HYPH|nr:helix-turn-helix domain-containing protein [Oharaeibacter diazotrophicus]TDP82489.1 AraC-like DNA-binding protein [Oharaeibacter diazotrophicus]BBE72747.1 helix-turn-helix domain protein [Pleomorphomonas sp. SM30]GLS76783.1 AraC family transcriptional regulator [Oharaeibacter diazotrophicus]